jgi:hypothetical protein
VKLGGFRNEKRRFTPEELRAGPATRSASSEVKRWTNFPVIAIRSALDIDPAALRNPDQLRDGGIDAPRPTRPDDVRSGHWPISFRLIQAKGASARRQYVACSELRWRI